MPGRKFAGIYPALVTPFDEKEELSVKSLETLVKKLISQGVTGLFAGGSTGEFPLLSLEERKTLFQVVSEAAGPDVVKIAHIGAGSTKNSIHLAEFAGELGYSAVSSVPPGYFKFSPEEIIQYYRDITSAVKMPLIIYNIPGLTGVEHGAPEYRELFENEWIQGIKHTSWNLFFLQVLREKYPDLTILNGFDELMLPALTAGADGGIGSTYNFMAGKFIRLRELFQEGKHEEAREEQRQITSIVDVLVTAGVFQAVKYALELQGVDCGRCRLPFKPLDRDAKRMVKKIMKNYDLI